MVRRNRGSWGVAVALALGLAAAGCGGDGGSEDLAGDPGGPDVPADLPADLPADVPVPDVPADPGTPDAVPDAAPDAVPDAVPDALPDAAADVPPDVPPEPDPALRLRQAGWLTGDLHLHTTYSDGEDTVPTVIGLAEALSDPVFLAFHPEYQGNPIDFIALTDHRTADQNSDPGFASDRVILIPGEEFGSPGHANLFNVTATVPHDPGGDGVTTQDYFDGFETAHAMGAVASVNHPTNPGIQFAWDIRNYDSMEVWNVRWGISPALVPADVDAWEAAKKAKAAAAFRKSAQYGGISGNHQSLKFYEALLARGKHVAMVGGSDRHVLFPVGFPASWVRAGTKDVAGVVEGIRARHTFVSRTPVSATIEMSLATGGKVYEMGDEVPIPAEGVQVTVDLRVTRSPGARLMLVYGHAVASDEALAEAELGTNVLDVAVEGRDFSASHTLTVMPGDWFYPVVYEPLIPPGLDPALAQAVPGIAEKVSQGSEENYAPIIEGLLPYLDLDVILDPAACDPSLWERDDAQCLPADQEGMATFFFPDWIDRILNFVKADGQATEWTMGAVGSAMRFVAAR